LGVLESSRDLDGDLVVHRSTRAGGYVVVASVDLGVMSGIGKRSSRKREIGESRKDRARLRWESRIKQLPVLSI
jgi:hypothetical protein